jgi:hypothetical protein
MAQETRPQHRHADTSLLAHLITSALPAPSATISRISPQKPAAPVALRLWRRVAAKKKVAKVAKKPLALC